jgi:hypothetical protein
MGTHKKKPYFSANGTNSANGKEKKNKNNYNFAHIDTSIHSMPIERK